MDSNLPHLKFQTAEFINLADAEAVIDGITIPLHSHVLSGASNVFAQLFSTLAEDDDGKGTPSKPTSVTELLAGESLEAVKVLLLMFYHREDTDYVIKYRTWGRDNEHAGAPTRPDQKLPAALLQSTIRLADKLDCRYIIREAERHNLWLVRSDPLGWLFESRRLGLHKIATAALTQIAEGLAPSSGGPGYRSVDANWAINIKASSKLLQDKRWLEVDPATLMLVMEANALVVVNRNWELGNRNTSFMIKEDALDGYSGPGDLLSFHYPVDTLDSYLNRAQEGEEQQPLHVLPELQEEQILADFNEEWIDEQPEVMDD